METDFILNRSARPRTRWRCWCALIAACVCVLNSGCVLFGSRQPLVCAAPYETTVNFLAADADAGVDALASAEAQYAAAREADEAGNVSCVDRYYAAAVQAWPFYVPVATTEERAAELYRAAVRGFIESANKYRALQPSGWRVVGERAGGAGRLSRVCVAAGGFCDVYARRQL